jgi:Ctf8
VGYHELSGTKLSLKKPLLVLKKKKAVREVDSVSNSEIEMEVIGIIRHRILFRSRPKALISSTFCFFDPLFIQCSSSFLSLHSSKIEWSDQIFGT